MLCLAQVATTVAPARTSLRIAIFCSSLNRLFFISFCLSKGRTTAMSCPLFGGQATPTGDDRTDARLAAGLAQSFVPMLYSHLLAFHSLMRWIILAAAVVAV